MAGSKAARNKDSKTPAPAQAPAQKPESEARQRVKGDGPQCPQCGADSFVTTTRKYPQVIARRMRYYQCANGHNFKQ